MQRSYRGSVVLGINVAMKVETYADIYNDMALWLLSSLCNSKSVLRWFPSWTNVEAALALAQNQNQNHA